MLRNMMRRTQGIARSVLNNGLRITAAARAATHAKAYEIGTCNVGEAEPEPWGWLQTMKSALYIFIAATIVLTIVYFVGYLQGKRSTTSFSWPVARSRDPKRKNIWDPYEPSPTFSRDKSVADQSRGKPQESEAKDKIQAKHPKSNNEDKKSSVDKIDERSSSSKSTVDKSSSTTDLLWSRINKINQLDAGEIRNVTKSTADTAVHAPKADLRVSFKDDRASKIEAEKSSQPSPATAKKTKSRVVVQGWNVKKIETEKNPSFPLPSSSSETSQPIEQPTIYKPRCNYNHLTSIISQRVDDEDTGSQSSLVSSNAWSMVGPAGETRGQPQATPTDDWRSRANSQVRSCREKNPKMFRNWKLNSNNCWSPGTSESSDDETRGKPQVIYTDASFATGAPSSHDCNRVYFSPQCYGDWRKPGDTNTHPQMDVTSSSSDDAMPPLLDPSVPDTNQQPRDRLRPCGGAITGFCHMCQDGEGRVRPGLNTFKCPFCPHVHCCDAICLTEHICALHGNEHITAIEKRLGNISSMKARTDKDGARPMSDVITEAIERRKGFKNPPEYDNLKHRAPKGQAASVWDPICSTPGCSRFKNKGWDTCCRFCSQTYSHSNECNTRSYDLLNESKASSSTDNHATDSPAVPLQYCAGDNVLNPETKHWALHFQEHEGPPPPLWCVYTGGKWNDKQCFHANPKCKAIVQHSVKTVTLNACKLCYQDAAFQPACFKPPVDPTHRPRVTCFWCNKNTFHCTVCVCPVCRKGFCSSECLVSHLFPTEVNPRNEKHCRWVVTMLKSGSSDSGSTQNLADN